jgi:anthranilate synthase/aminodeoxychorismate synthase-like glutamine amidotransferase
MICVIDNYDSFVWNIARMLAEMDFPVEVHRHDAITVNDIQHMQPSHIILSPGPCGPSEAGICLELVNTLGPSTPILGICLGHQVIAAAAGANIIQAKQPMHGETSEINFIKKSIFSKINDTNMLTVARYHSLIVDDRHLPNILEPLAWDCSKQIMALQHTTQPSIGLQFHPESFLTQAGGTLLAAFLAQQARLIAN